MDRKVVRMFNNNIIKCKKYHASLIKEESDFHSCTDLFSNALFDTDGTFLLIERNGTNGHDPISNTQMEHPKKKQNRKLQ